MRLSSSWSSSHHEDKPQKPDKQDTTQCLQPSSPKKAASTKIKSSKKLSYGWTKATLALAVPALIGMIADPVLSLMDTYFTSKLGTVPLAALGACTSIFHLAFNAFRATTAATTSLIASALAKTESFDNKNNSAKKSLIQSPTQSAQMVLSTSLQCSFCLGLVVTSILYFLGQPILKLMGIPSTSPLFPHALSYLRIRSLAAPVVLFITVSEGAFRGYGDTRVPLLASAAAAVWNAVMDPIMMFAWGMGVAGAAAATAWSQVVAMGVYIYMIRRRGMLMPRLSNKLKEQDNDGLPLVVNGAGASPLSTPVLPHDEMSLVPAVSYNTTVQDNSPSMSETQQPLENTDGTFHNTIDANSINNSRKVSASSSASSSSTTSSTNTTPTTPTKPQIILAILQANLAMMLKQGSLLLAWAFATSRATRIGYKHVAAHQVALSLWLMFALVQDGAAVAGQVLMGRTWWGGNGDVDNAADSPRKQIHSQSNKKDIQSQSHPLLPTIRSLSTYMLQFAILQSILCSSILFVLARRTATSFALSDPTVSHLLHSLVPIITLFQPLVGLTLVTESLVVGAHCFNWLAAGTTVATVVSMMLMRQARSIMEIWQGGLVALFVGRLVTALLGVAWVNEVGSLIGIRSGWLRRRISWRRQKAQFK